MNYSTYIDQMRKLLVINATDTDFPVVIPNMIEYAELRIYRELDFLHVRSAPTALATSGSRNVTVPASLVVVESANLISPAGVTDPELGTRVPLDRQSLDYINFVWPTAATTGEPSVYALLTNTAARLAPTPDGSYTVEFIGTTRPAPLSASNPTTFITDNMPDLFVEASLIFGFIYQRDSAMQAAAEANYQALKAGVGMEALRQKAQSASWTPYQPSPIANMPRTTPGA